MPREENKEIEEERRARTAYDLMRIRLKRLERNIEKPAPIPARKEEYKPKPPPEFVRNVVGSSAAAGSAEFHIFRNNKRRELERLEYIEKRAVKEELDKEFEEKKKARKEAEEKRTAKKRQKRLRQKESRKRSKQDKKKCNGSNPSSSDGEPDTDAESGPDGEEANGSSATEKEGNRDDVRTKEIEAPSDGP